MSTPVTGATDHYARAELVTLVLDRGRPAFLDRRRVELIAPHLPSAPYHHEALEMELGEAQELVDRVRASVAEHARHAVSTLIEELAPEILILPTSPYESLPDALEQVLASRPLTNAADGMLYRELLAEAALESGLEVRRYPRKSDPVGLAAEALGTTPAEVHALVAAFGKEAGAPWRKDHKLAAAAALSALAPRARS